MEKTVNPVGLHVKVLHAIYKVASVLFVLALVGALVTLMLTVASCGSGATESTTQTPGMEVRLDQAGNPVDIVRIPGPPGHPIQVTIRNHKGEIIEQERFTDMTDVVRRLPPSTQATMDSMATRFRAAMIDSPDTTAGHLE